MAITSVSSSAGTVQQQVATEKQNQYQPASKPPRRDEAAQTDSSRKTQESRASSQAERPERANETQRIERERQLRPVVNAQGQKTGTIINTTA